MAKTSIYLPDDLAEQVRTYGIPISEVAQGALRQAVKDAHIKESVMTDIQAVAERLRATRNDAAKASAAKAAEMRRHGGEWARRDATAAELEYMTFYNGPRNEFQTPLSLINYAAGVSRRGHYGHGMPPSSGIPMHPGDTYWADLAEGAREVWDAVGLSRELLVTEIDVQGGIVPAGGYGEVENPEYRIWMSREPAPEAPYEEHERHRAKEPSEFL